jgi:hypothetical protein
MLWRKKSKLKQLQFTHEKAYSHIDHSKMIVRRFVIRNPLFSTLKQAGNNNGGGRLRGLFHNTAFSS